MVQIMTPPISQPVQRLDELRQSKVQKLEPHHHFLLYDAGFKQQAGAHLLTARTDPSRRWCLIWGANVWTFRNWIEQSQKPAAHPLRRVTELGLSGQWPCC